MNHHSMKPRGERLFSLSREALSRTQDTLTSHTDSSQVTMRTDHRAAWDVRDELNNWDDDGGHPAAMSQAAHDEAQT